MQSIKTSEKTRLSSGEFDSIRYWCQDETRLGLKTIEKRKITLQGVKPLGLESVGAASLLFIWCHRTIERRKFLL